MKNKSELTKKNLIDAELERLLTCFPRITPEFKALVLPLLERLAFMTVELSSLEDEIINNGSIETYDHGGGQKGMKQSAATQTYCSLVKNYSAAITKILKMAPLFISEVEPEKKPERTTRESTLSPEEKARREAEHLERINAEIKAAAEKQKAQRKEWESSHGLI